MQKTDDVVEAVRALRLEMAIRFTGTFSENAQNTLSAAEAALASRQTVSDGLVYVPGVFRCAKCGFRLIQSNLNAVDGSVTARDAPGEPCPNDGAPMWRVSWKQYAEEQIEGYDRLLSEKEAQLTALRQDTGSVVELLKEVCATCETDYGFLPADLLSRIGTMIAQLEGGE